MQSSVINSSTHLAWKWQGKSYKLPISEPDLLSLARAVEEEGYPEEGVAWCLIQRAAWLNTHGLKIRLGKLIEQYAQPINPEWFPNGIKHSEEIARLTRLGDAAGVKDEKARASRRYAKATKTWAQITPETKAILANILTNRKKSPVPGAVHYWASRAADFTGNQAKKPALILLDRGYGFGPGRNVFFAEKGSQNFSGIKVMHGSNNGMDLLIAGFNPLSVLIASAVGFAAWKWWT